MQTDLDKIQMYRHRQIQIGDRQMQTDLDKIQIHRHRQIYIDVDIFR